MLLQQQQDRHKKAHAAKSLFICVFGQEQLDSTLSVLPSALLLQPTSSAIGMRATQVREEQRKAEHQRRKLAAALEAKRGPLMQSKERFALRKARPDRETVQVRVESCCIKTTRAVGFEQILNLEALFYEATLLSAALTQPAQGCAHAFFHALFISSGFTRGCGICAG